MGLQKVTAGRKAYTMRVGNSIEDLFKSVLISRGCEVEKSSREDDIKKHIDFYVNGIGVDVKAKRELNKIWLELVNVGGNKGWLKGEAEYIAFHFERFNHFKFFKREDLLKFVEENVTEKCKTSKPFMKFYTRSKWDQKDVLVKVSYEHIKHLYHFIIKC